MPDIEDVGKVLFGNPTRLRLALWALRHDKQFFQSEPPREVGVPTAIRLELEKLVNLDMLARQHPPGENRVYYERTRSALWEIIEAAEHALRPVHPETENTPD